LTSGKNFRILKIDETMGLPPACEPEMAAKGGRDFFEVFIDPTGPVSARTGALHRRRYLSGFFYDKQRNYGGKSWKHQQD